LPSVLLRNENERHSEVVGAVAPAKRELTIRDRGGHSGITAAVVGEAARTRKWA
jgi:hypothetical protein